MLDVILPDANGIDLQRHLAKTDPDLPIVLITGHMDDALRERALGSGAFAFLAKPPRVAGVAGRDPAGFRLDFVTGARFS